MTTANSPLILKLLHRVNTLLDVKNDKSRNTIALLAIGIFIAGLYVALRRLDRDVVWHLSAGFLTGMFALLSLTFLINSLRTHASALIVGSNLNFVDNARISLFGSAMNMLPLVIPAGMAMRMSNFVQHGGETKLVVSVMLTNYLLSICSSLLLGIALLAANGFSHLQIPLTLLGMLYIASLALFVKFSGMTYGLRVAILELAAVGVDAIRIYVCFRVLGFSIEWFQATILTVSAILGSAVSIVPAGLGVRELVGAMISPLIAVVPAQTYLAIALNRVFGMLFFVGLSGLVLLTDRSAAR
jgi:uncharacterized membrane protein YbhN (UPF0104 family)